MPPAHHLPGERQRPATSVETKATAQAPAPSGAVGGQAAAVVAPAPQPNAAPVVPVKLKLKAPKLLIKGSFGQAADVGASGAGGQPLKKVKHKQPQLIQQPPPAAAQAGLPSTGGLEERKQRKKRQREGDLRQRQVQKQVAPLMAGLITPSVSEQGGGGGAASTAQGGAASGGLATPSSAAPASSAQVRSACGWFAFIKTMSSVGGTRPLRLFCHVADHWTSSSSGYWWAGCGQQTCLGHIGAQDAGPRHREAVQEGPAPHLPAARHG